MGNQVSAPGGAFLQYNESAQFALTQAGQVTFTHLLGIKPKLYWLVLICQTAEQGFSIGDEIVSAWVTNTASNVGFNLRATATQIVMRIGNDANPFRVVNDTTGNVAQLTLANWKGVLRAARATS